MHAAAPVFLAPARPGVRSFWMSLTGRPFRPVDVGHARGLLIKDHDTLKGARVGLVQNALHGPG